MRAVNFYSGRDLIGMFGAATTWLERSAAEVNALNVFPIPDGDTGTNMLLTMRSAMAEAYRSPEESASAVAHAMAHGSLMGARGNSGVILSQILRGLAVMLDDKDALEASDLVAGLVEGSSLAYKALSRPVEGTILTVIREASTAALEFSTANGDLLATIEVFVDAARDSVARTPSLLSVLREAGVVDAGGLGLYVIFEGALRFLRGEVDEGFEGYKAPEPISVPQVRVPAAEDPYGYCTECIIEGNNLSLEHIRERLEAIGESVLVVGDENTARIHVHTLDPGNVISYATSLGTLRQVKVQNMDDQHEDFLAMQPSLIPIATVAVVSGGGLGQVFRSLGVSDIVPGGQTMNPSTEELLRAVETVPAEKVILLPNNPNVVLAAEQARELSAKQVEVVATESIPQGIAALLAFNHEADFEANIRAMGRARETVRTIEITRAVRKAKFGDLVMAKGQPIGFLDDELVAAADSMFQVIDEVLGKMDLEQSEIITLYYGADTEDAEAEQIAEALRQKYPQLEVEVIYGGQPHYNYILSLE